RIRAAHAVVFARGVIRFAVDEDVAGTPARVVAGAINVGRRAARPQAARFESAHRAETAGEEVGIERQAVEIAVTVAITELKVEAAGERFGQRQEHLRVVHELVVFEIAARQRHLERHALRTPARGQLAAVQRRLRPRRGKGELVERIAMNIEKARAGGQRIEEVLSIERQRAGEFARSVLYVVIIDVLERPRAADNFPRRAVAGIDAGIGGAKSERQTLCFAERIAKRHVGAGAAGGVVGDVDLAELGLAMEYREAAADTVLGEIRIDIAETYIGQVFAAVHADTDLLTGTEEIVFLQI